MDHLDTVYISHSDFDHSGALDSLRAHFPVKKVIKTAQKPKQIGPMKMKFLKRTKTFGNENDDCQVLYITLNGYHYLFTGDISETAESNLVDHYKKLDVDVLKVAHHGSRHASSVKFFEMVSPKIAFIGVGKNNFYGHPGDIVIKRLNERNVYILRTDQDGNFCIRDYVFVKGHFVFKHNH
jgi:competence protein ComEC